jgi:hypothetical protein
MGTSTGYSMPSGGEWTPLKTDVTEFAKQGPSGSRSPMSILRNYLNTIGGSEGISRGAGHGTRGGGGTGGVGGGRSTIVGTARNVGSFLNRVRSVGLDDALREIGLPHLIGKSAAELATGLLDSLAGPASTLDDAAIRAALADLNEELLEEAESYEDVERVLTEMVDRQGLTHILGRLFGHYIYERFCRDFYERLVKKVGSLQASNSLDAIKDCIESSLRARLVNRDVTKINWRGVEGRQVTDQVLRETVEIFGVA